MNQQDRYDHILQYAQVCTSLPSQNQTSLETVPLCGARTFGRVWFHRSGTNEIDHNLASSDDDNNCPGVVLHEIATRAA